jgi:hypothetical protein
MRSQKRNLLTRVIIWLCCWRVILMLLIASLFELKEANKINIIISSMIPPHPTKYFLEKDHPRIDFVLGSIFNFLSIILGIIFNILTSFINFQKFSCRVWIAKIFKIFDSKLNNCYRLYTCSTLPYALSVFTFILIDFFFSLLIH